MGLMSPDVNLVGTFLDRLSMLDLQGPFRAQLANVGLPPDTPKAFAIAAVCMLMAQCGLQAYETTYIASALRELDDSMLDDAVVFVENGSVLGVPVKDGNMLVDRMTLHAIEPDERSPTVTTQVWYTNPLLQAAKDVFEQQGAQ